MREINELRDNGRTATFQDRSAQLDRRTWGDVVEGAAIGEVLGLRRPSAIVMSIDVATVLSTPVLTGDRHDD